LGQIRKINDVYYIEFYARGLLYSQPAGQTQEQAEVLLAQVEAKIAGGEALTITRHIELVDFFGRFLIEARNQSHSVKTLQRFSSTITHFNSFLQAEFPQVHQLAQLTPSVFESYKAYLAKTRKSKIVNLTILLLREILEYGIKLGFINDNPTLHLRLLPWPKSPKRKPTERHDKIKQLLSKGVGVGKLAQLLNFRDIARILYYSNLIPLSREDMYH